MAQPKIAAKQKQQIITQACVFVKKHKVRLHALFLILDEYISIPGIINPVAEYGDF